MNRKNLPVPTVTRLVVVPSGSIVNLFTLIYLYNSTNMSLSQYNYVLKSVQLCPQVSTIMSSSQYNYVLKLVQLCLQVSTIMSSSQYNYVLKSVQLCPQVSTIMSSSQYN